MCAGVIRNAQARPGWPAPAVFLFLHLFFNFFIRPPLFHNNILFIFFLESARDLAHTHTHTHTLVPQHNTYFMCVCVYDFSYTLPFYTVGRGNENEI